MIITEKDSSFKDYYLECVQTPYFKTALLNELIPDMGSFFIKNDKVICFSIVYKVSQLDEIIWWTTSWGAIRKNANTLQSCAKQTIKRMPKHSRILSYILSNDEKDSLIYRASLLSAKKMGFKIIESHKICDIIEYRI